MSLPLVAAGIVSSRSRDHELSVAWSDGAVVGVRLSTAALPPALTSGWVTLVTPSAFSRSSRRSCSRGSVALFSAFLRWSPAFSRSA